MCFLGASHDAVPLAATAWLVESLHVVPSLYEPRDHYCALLKTITQCIAKGCLPTHPELNTEVTFVLGLLLQRVVLYTDEESVQYCEVPYLRESLAIVEGTFHTSNI